MPTSRNQQWFQQFSHQCRIRGLRVMDGIRRLGVRGVALRALLLFVTVGSGTAGYLVGESGQYAPERERWIAIDAAWKNELPRREPSLGNARGQAPAGEEDPSSIRYALVDTQLGKLRAELIRLRLMYEVLSETAGLEEQEFELLDDPLSRWNGSPEESLEVLDRSVAHMSHQTEQMARVLGEWRSEKDMTISGRPVSKVNVSSGFGMRVHPVQGTRSMHKGIDYRGEPGDPIFAVADGIVTFSGRNGSYGNLVELEHSDGYLTRYAHNKENTVELGQLVDKGDIVARIGSTGRTTGPHLHFEIRHRGGAVDPLVFVR